MQQILRQIPNIADLKKDGYTPIDMHFHTDASDGAADLKTTLKTAEKLGIGIAITDHNEIRNSIKAVRVKWKNIAIPAIEATTQDRSDLLIYFYSLKELEEFYSKHIKDFEKPKFLNFKALTHTLEELIDITKDYNCLTSAAHPIVPYPNKNIKKHKNNNDILSKIDAIEAINGGVDRYHNNKAIKLAKATKKPITCGSDGHTIKPLGKFVTCSREDNIDDFLDSIRKRKNIIVGKERSLPGLIFSHASCFIRNVF